MIAQVQIRERSGEDCVANNGFCPGWIADNLDRYWEPLGRHVLLTVVPVAIGFVIAFGLALLVRRWRGLDGPIVATTGILYTIPALAFFAFLVQPLGFGFWTAVVPLTAYTLLILYRNIVAGLRNVPSDARDAARGMGLTSSQLLWRVELPLALPEILAGVRIATVTTVGLASLAFFGGGGGLGDAINADIAFKSNVAVAGGLCILLAVAFELTLLAAERLALPWRRAAR